jgi:hypothetical protein
MLGHILKGGTLGNRESEKRVTATKKAVETPGGGRYRPRTTNASRHRRAASRSGGATSAERDGRPVELRTIPDAAAGSESIRTHDSCARHLSTVTASLGVHRYADEGELRNRVRGSSPIQKNGKCQYP